MNKNIKKISLYVLPAILWFTILFDPSGIALGSTMFELSAFVFSIAKILGNLIWLIGLILFIVSGLLCILLFNTTLFKKMIQESINLKINNNDYNITLHTLTDKYGNILFNKRSSIQIFYKYFMMLGAITAIGSGFWFTGTGWLFASIVGEIYRKTGIKYSEQMIAEHMNKTFQRS